MKKKDKIMIIAGILAILTGVYAIFFLPQEREVTNLWIFLFKLLPFIFASVTIAFFEKDYLIRTKLLFPTFLIAFLIYFAVFIPKIFFYLDDFQLVYYYTLMEVPYIILFLVFAFRMGGGTTVSTIKLALFLLLIMLSGIEDLAFLTVNNHTDPQWKTIPDIWTWASHIKVRIGHFPTKYEAYGFIVIHFILAFIVAYVPFDKVIKKIRKNYEIKEFKS